MKIETKRLILKTPSKKDLKEVFTSLNNLEISKNLSSVSYPYSKKEGENWIRESKSNLKNKTGYSFVIYLKNKNKFLGAVELFKIDKPNKVGETRSWIKKEFQGNGYITEAKKELFNFAFHKLNLRKIDSGVFVSNEASKKVSNKLGFKLEGTKREAVICKATGEIKDMYIYGLLKEEWLNLQK